MKTLVPAGRAPRIGLALAVSLLVAPGGDAPATGAEPDAKLFARVEPIKLTWTDPTTGRAGLTERIDGLMPVGSGQDLVWGTFRTSCS